MAAVPQQLGDVSARQRVDGDLVAWLVAALVGTTGLGQQVYIALGKANTGMGLVAGLGIAMIAMIADRITQAWSLRRKAALGL